MNTTLKQTTLKHTTLKRLSLQLPALLFLALLAACGPAEQDGTLNAVSTIGMINDIVQNVGGEHVTSRGLMGPGVDPHLYKASEGDVRLLSNADVVFYNGLHLEARMGEVLEQMEGRTVAVTQRIPEEELLGSETYEGQYDPHVWFDVKNWISATAVVRDALSERDPEHAEDYSRNAEAYLERLRELDTYVRQRAEELPEEQRVLVTAHDAFRYFGKQYGFEVVGLQGISTESQAGTKDVQELVEFIVERKIKALFVESSIPERNLRAVQEAVRAQGSEVEIGGELFSDAMGDEGTEEGTYPGMVRHNIDTIVDALGDS